MMKAQTFFLVVVGLVASAATIVAWRARQARILEEATIAVARRDHAALVGRAAGLRERLAKEQERARAAQAVRTPARVVAPEIREAKAKPRELTVSDVIKLYQQEGNRPEAQVRALAARRAGLTERFAPFYRRARLTPPQIQAFEDIWMRRDERHGDLNAAAHSQGLSLSDPGVARMRGEIYAEHEKAQRALLGDVGYGELRDHERSMGAWDMVRHLSAAATVRGVPFSTEQMDRFVRATVNASDSYRKGQNVSTGEVDWGAVLEQAAGFLSASQLALVRTSEPPGGGIFGARWNSELNKATRAAKAGGG